MKNANFDNIAGEIANLIKKSSRTCVLTGAGLSTESGIPDFRSPKTGLWNKYDPMELLSTDTLYSNPKLFYTESLKILLPMIEALPNKAHEMLAALEKEGYIYSLTTQNIDNLHYRAGSRKIYEVHGNLRTCHCMQCGRSFDFSIIISKSDNGEIPPLCNECGGVLRTDVVLFGDRMPGCFEEAYNDISGSDLLIVIGSSLQVAPVNMLPQAARKLVIINIGETSYDRRADILYNEKASVALTNIYAELKKEEI